MSMDSRDWIRDIVKQAVREELKVEPQEVTLTSRRMATLTKSMPIAASVKLPGDRVIEISLTIWGDSYTDFRVARETPKP